MKAFVNKLLSKSGVSAVRLVSERDLQLLDTVKRELLTRDDASQENYIPKIQLGHAGFSLRDEEQLALLRSFESPEFQKLFEALRTSDEINVGFWGREFRSQGLIHNGYYPTPDAEIYAAMIASYKPETIVEVGSGFSTAIARATVQHLGLKSRIHIIDPEPRRNIEKMADQIEYKRVEQSSLTDLKFSNRTLFFIDSSHVCRSGGDLPFLFCQSLPTIPAGVLVHIHDVFLPFDYPANYYERFYTEEYLLHALLSNSSKFQVVLGAHYMVRAHLQAMQAAFGRGVGNDPYFFGAAFWMKAAA